MEKTLSTECKCNVIASILSKMPEHCCEYSKDGTYENLDKYGIRFKYAEEALEKEIRSTSWPTQEEKKKFMERTKDGYDTLSWIHFSCDRSEFLPNEILYWIELEEGEYEKIVEALYEKLTEIQGKS